MPRPKPNRSKVWIIAVYSLLAAGSAAMTAYGLKTQAVAWILGGLLGLIVSAATAPVALLLAGLVGRLREAGPLSSELARIREHSMLSDNAKRVLFRDREIQLLRDAIEEDIARSDYNAAITLCEEMANLFGYRQEAEAFRSRILRAREEQYELEVQAAIDQFEASVEDRQWAAVYQQAARIRRLYPDSHLVDGLEQRIAQARDEHKHELETRFLKAAEEKDVEAAMALLKQLDRYLTQEEAGRLTKVAEGVIVRHRDSLGTRFRQTVGERRWADAVRMGETIIDEFPNSQMAAEVRSMLDVLRSRAGQTTVTAEGTD